MYSGKVFSLQLQYNVCRSELSAEDAMRRFNAPRSLLLLPRVSVLRHCDASATNFTAAELRVYTIVTKVRVIGGDAPAAASGTAAAAPISAILDVSCARDYPSSHESV
ncbi:hypothetical protein EVAR_24980_1 [Eumeta japonica]|uniref:Uncharacterized protein n=1 Tax=Eumeta variegata TaxID=151549 RepID=A0A4C1XKY1_EUMVA|nr:hypothetical protein EVAR_24980_1 [Eumeta japonica]